jgi:hypothetical protein
MKPSVAYMKYIYILSMILYALVPCDVLAQPVGDIREMISENNGTIRESYFAGANRGIIVHIQDLHCNYDAQISIYNIINELIDKYSLGLVAIEGCAGELDTAPYSRKPNNTAKEDTAKYFIKSGQLDGAAFAHIMRHSGFTFWGADDILLHQKNTEAYKQSLAGQEDNLRFYSNIKEIITDIKEEAYTGKLKELDENITAYKNEALDFTVYIKYLNKLVEDKELDSSQYPNFLKLVEVVEKESAIDFLEVDNQRAEYVDMLSQRLDRERLSELLDKSLYFKTGKISPLLFYSYLEDIAKIEGITEFEKDYSQLALYVSYIRLYSEIGNTELFKEIESVEKDIKQKLFINEDQRRIDRASYTLDILRDLFELKLTKDTLEHYRSNRKEFTPSYFINLVSDMAKKYNVSYKLDPVFRNIAQRLPNMERFYNLAEERDGTLVHNTINAMRRENSDMAVLVAGGFHTDGITKLLKDQGVSYIVVTPRIQTLDPDNPYQSVLLGEKSEFEKFIEQAKESTKQYRESL